MTQPMDAWESISGQTMVQEISTLQKYVRDLPDGSIIVELGVCQGRSGLGIALACQGTNKKVWLIDDFNPENPGYVSPNHKKTVANIVRLGLQKWTGIIVSDSTEAGHNWDKGPVALLFHDASHEYWKVKEDLLAWLPNMEKGGYIALHDYDVPKHSTHRGVKKAADEVLGKPIAVQKRLGIFQCN